MEIDHGKCKLPRTGITSEQHATAVAVLVTPARIDRGGACASAPRRGMYHGTRFGIRMGVVLTEGTRAAARVRDARSQVKEPA
jgi:hypothetical protein